MSLSCLGFEFLIIFRSSELSTRISFWNHCFVLSLGEKKLKINAMPCQKGTLIVAISAKAFRVINVFEKN